MMNACGITDSPTNITEFNNIPVNPFVWYPMTNSTTIINPDTASAHSYAQPVSNDLCGLINNIDNDRSAKFEIYPNPFVDKISVASKSSITSYISVFNLMGTKVFESEIVGEKILDLNYLESGIYVVEMRSGDSLLFMKIIKI
jgi:hypothetical protein